MSYYVDILPSVALPHGRSTSYTYQSDRELPIGTLATIPFGKQTLRGVVTACYPSSTKRFSYPIKPVATVDEHLALGAPEISLLQSLSHDTLTAPTNTLRQFLPPERKRWPKDFEQARGALETPVSAGAPLPWAEPTLGTLLAAHTAGTLLIIVPEVLLLRPLAESIKGLYPSLTVYQFSSHHNAGDHALLYHTLSSPSAAPRVVVGTRQSVFLRYTDLSRVVVLLPADKSHKQWDMAPRYHAATVAEQLADLHQAKYLEVTPTLASPKQKLTLVNLREERYRQRATLVTDALETAIRETLTRGQSVLIQSHQRGGRGTHICSNCQAVLRCPTCAKPLFEGNSKRDLVCSNGHTLDDPFPSCAQCHGHQFRTIGDGADSVARLLAKSHSKYPLIVLDAQTKKPTRANWELLEERLQQTGPVIVLSVGGVSAALIRPDFGLVAYIDADHPLHFPEYRSEGDLLSNLRVLYETLPRAGQLLLQTREPEHPLYQAVTDQAKYAEVTKRIEGERRIALYPPFGHVLKVTVSRAKNTTVPATTIHTRLLGDLERLIATEGIRDHRLRVPPVRDHLSPSLLLSFPGTLHPSIRSYLLRSTESIAFDLDAISILG